VMRSQGVTQIPVAMLIPDVPRFPAVKQVPVVTRIRDAAHILHAARNRREVPRYAGRSMRANYRKKAGNIHSSASAHSRSSSDHTHTRRNVRSRNLSVAQKVPGAPCSFRRH
jgi:hypothetical protein